MELSRKQEYRNQKYSIGVTLLSFIVMVIFFIFTNVITANSPSAPLALTEVAFDPNNGTPPPGSPENMTSPVSSKQESITDKNITENSDDVFKSNVDNIVYKFRTAKPKNESSDNSGGEIESPGNTNGTEDKTHGEKIIPNPSLGYDLYKRTLLQKPDFSTDTKEEGKVVVEITVDKNGVVIEADPNGRGTTTNSSHLKNEARKMALATKFNENQKLEEQRGTITIIFSFD